MEFWPIGLPGCYEISSGVRGDERGRFVKTFHESEFKAAGLRTDLREAFFTVSRGGVLRGLHFQRPPADHAKLVCCTAGSILDAAVDLRRGSPTFGRHVLVELDGDLGSSIYLPRGLAHGFYVMTEQATVWYLVTSAHSPEHDTGIRWDSAGIPWPDPAPLVSERDRLFPRLEEFVTPFSYDPETGG